MLNSENFIIIHANIIYSRRLIAVKGQWQFLGIALKDVVEYIKDAINSSYEDDSVPVFTRKSITGMYNDRFI